MDYKGNYFPEEHDENESKTYRAVKGFFKWTMYAISFALYAILMVVIFTNRDSKILKTNYITSLPEFSDIASDDLQLYRINPKEFMTEDGSLQVFNVDYSKEYKVMEIGFKFNAKKQTYGDKSDCIEYSLIDSDGIVYPLINKVIDDNGRYGFSRLCFSNIDIDLASNDLMFEGTDESERTQKSYTLIATHKDSGKELHKFLIYDNTVVFYKTDYKG